MVTADLCFLFDFMLSTLLYTVIATKKSVFILLDKKSIQFLLVLEKSLINKTLNGQMYFENIRCTIDFFLIYNAYKSACHRIGYLSWEGPTNSYLVQLPDHFRVYQKLKHIIKGIQMPPKYFLLSRKPVLVFYQRLSKEMLSNVRSERPLAQLRAVPMCPITKYLGEELNTSLSNSPHL